MSSNTVAFEHRTAFGDSASGPTTETGHFGITARLARWIAMLVAVTAMALMLAGSMTEPAGAATRPNLGTVAERCSDVGGDPTVYGFFGVRFTYCDFGDGTGVWGVD